MTKQPIWSAIAETLRAEITDGARRAGDRLPTEAELSLRFGVNRHTVRRALARLSEDGLVHSRRGAGVFVAAGSTDYPVGRRVRFHHQLEAAGRLPSRKILSLESRPATGTEATALDIERGGDVVVSEGVSLADGVALALFVSVFPAGRLPGITEALRQNDGVTRALAAVGVADYIRSMTRVTAISADAAQAAQLACPPGSALIRTESVSVIPGGAPVQYGLTHFVGERVTLTLDHS